MDELGTPHDRYFREDRGRLEIAGTSRTGRRGGAPGEIGLATLEPSKDT